MFCPHCYSQLISMRRRVFGYRVFACTLCPFAGIRVNGLWAELVGGQP